MAIPIPFEPPATAIAGCELCERPGGVMLCREGDWRVIRVEDAAFPAFYRVVSNPHVREFSQLAAPQRERCIALVCAVERALISSLAPTKINLASLGNAVPHLHWHVIARFDWDSHYPQPVWGTAQREVQPPPAARLPIGLGELDARVVAAVREVRAS